MNNPCKIIILVSLILLVILVGTIVYNCLNKNKENLEDKSNLLTVIITSSYIKSHPSTILIDSVIKSLDLINLPKNTKIILAHDYNNNKNFIEYIYNLKKKYTYNKNINIIVRKTKGHLTGNIRNVINLVKTKFILILQHDLPFINQFDIKKIIEDMNKNKIMKHIRFNTRSNIKIKIDNSKVDEDVFNIINIKNNYNYISTPGWSDQNHITYTNYYKNIILKECKDNNFMEYYLNGKIKNLKDHQKYGTFLFDKFNNKKAYIEHKDGKNFK